MVAELASKLDLPVSVVAIMLCDLLEAGRISVRQPRLISRAPDLDLLKKVRDGLGQALTPPPRGFRLPTR